MSYNKYISISETIANCLASGKKLAKDAKPIQSPIKQETSLIGMAYLNYIYQNDLENEHFCQSMLLMHSQISPNTENFYTHLFEPAMASETMSILKEIQLAFDYAIARTNLPVERIQMSVNIIQTTFSQNKISY